MRTGGLAAPETNLLSQVVSLHLANEPQEALIALEQALQS